MSLRGRLANAWWALHISAGSDEIGTEQAAYEARLAASPDAWRAWWDDRGERELRCILMVAWDPVGSSDAANAWDEYDNYLAGVGSQLERMTDEDLAASAIAAYLEHVERDFMEATPDEGRRAQLGDLADAIVAWHEWSFTHGGRPPHTWV